jgi:NB-ARC domain
VVLYGPAGAGKTTLVATVAHDLAAGVADRGGVLWLNVGDVSDPSLGLMRAVRVIERHDGRPPSRLETRDLDEEWEEYLSWMLDPERPRDVPGPSDDLRSWLSERACLMVLDDVSRADDARPLLVGAAGRPTVVIARDVKVDDDLAVRAVRLEGMDPGQSLALIESRVGARLDPDGRASALELAEAVGRLPLALEVLCAAGSSLGIPWSALRDGVLAEASRPRAAGDHRAGGPADRPTRLRDVVGFVLRRLPVDLREAFAWLGVLQAGATVSPELAGRLWRVDEGAAVTRLRRLAAVGLIAPMGPAGRATANHRLHQMMRDRAWNLATAPSEPASTGDLPGLGLPPSDAHSALLARIRDGGAAVTGSAAAALRLMDHLSRNMYDADLPEDVDVLLCEETPDGDNAWYLAREQRGDRPGYLQDVDRAWRRADAAALAGGGADPVARQCRYALIRASAAPEWPDPPPGLPALLVWSGRWSARRAAVAIRRIRYGWTRMSAWMALVPHLEGAAREDAVRAALDEARKQRTPEHRALALAEVMPVLNPAEREAVLHEAVELVRQAMNRPGVEYWRQKALVGLVPFLDARERTDLLRLLVDSPGHLRGSTFVELMTDLAADLGSDDYRDAVRLVLDGYRGKLSFVERAQTLRPLGPPDDSGAYRGGLREALADARDRLRAAIAQQEKVSAFYRAQGPGSHINYIPIDFFAFFSELCSLLTGPDLADLREEALELARGAGSSYQFCSLVVLVPVMEPGQTREVAAEALRAYAQLELVSSVDPFLFSLLPYLDGPDRRLAWGWALKQVRSAVSGLSFRFQTRKTVRSVELVPMTGFLGCLDEAELQELMEAIRDARRSVRDDKPSARPWLDILPFLREPRRREFLRAYPRIDDEDSRAVLLRAALPFLRVPLRPEWSAELLAAARSLRTTRLRAEMLAALLPRQTDSDRKAVLADVLDAFRRVHESQERLVLVRLLAANPPDDADQVAGTANLIKAVREISQADGTERGIETMEMIAALGHRLDRFSLHAALSEAMREIRAGIDQPNDYFQYLTAAALTSLAPCLSEPDHDEVRREALALARTLDCGVRRDSTVISLLLPPGAPVHEERLREALEFARGVDSKYARVWALARVAEAVDGEARRTVAHEALSIARDIEEGAPLSAVLPVLDGPERLELARELFAGARGMKNDRWRSLAYKGLIAYLG